MLMVAPTGSTKRMMRRSMWLFSNRHLNVIGNVAELEELGGGRGGQRSDVRGRIFNSASQLAKIPLVALSATGN